ncbi:hypothetical protein ACP70R_006611 [Stipagrostis hirtigluma subsp. patula]
MVSSSSLAPSSLDASGSGCQGLLVFHGKRRTGGSSNRAQVLEIGAGGEALAAETAAHVAENKKARNKRTLEVDMSRVSSDDEENPVGGKTRAALEL